MVGLEKTYPAPFAVIVGEVYPEQIVTLTNDRDFADGLTAYLNDNVRDVVTVKKNGDYVLSKLVIADRAWVDAANKFSKGKE